MFKRFILTFMLAVLWISCARGEQGGVAYILDIRGVIGPATSDYFHRALEKARTSQAHVIILRIDTPGGLSSSMREMIQDILKSPIPIIGYVDPSGARAASAGTYILYAVHLAAMAPGTNLGAATPVQVGGGILPSSSPKDSETEKDDKGKPVPTIKDKILNDSVAYIRSLAQLRGRNVKWAEKAVREAASLSAVEAQKERVIDFIADDLNDLFAKLDGREIKIAENVVKLRTAGIPTVTLAPDWRSQFLSIITDPNIAYILMLIGVYGLILEFYSPGLVGPGIIGSISLLLAFYAFNVLPVNYAALGLIFLGIVFMVLEANSPSFGILGLGGAAAFIIGSIMLIDTDVQEFAISWQLIASFGTLFTFFFMLVIVMLGQSRRRPVVTGLEEMLNATGEVLSWEGDAGQVRLHGEIWRAKGEGAFNPGSHVRVTRIDGLIVTVAPDSGKA